MMRVLSEWIGPREILCLVGFVLFAAGLWIVSLPLALIACGIVLLVTGALPRRRVG